MGKREAVLSWGHAESPNIPWSFRLATDSTSQLVKGIYGRVTRRLREMEIDGSGIQRAVSKQGLQGDQVHAVFITVGCVCAPERMGAKPAIDTEFLFLLQNDTLQPLFIHWCIQGTLLCEKPLPRPLPNWQGKPVIHDPVPDGRGEWNITVGMVLRALDIDLSGIKVDIGASQMAEFIQPHAGGIKNRDGKIGFWVIKRLQETPNQIPVWYKRKIYIKSTERYLCLIPGLVQDIGPKELEVRNDQIYCAVR